MTLAAIKTDQKQAETQIFDIADYGRVIRALPKNIISLPEKIILLALADHFGNNGKIYPSNKKIGNETALADQTVLNCLSSLKKKKLIFYPKQYNKKRRYIQLYDPITKALLIPKLYLVKDSTIPEQVGSINKNVPGERTKQQQPEATKSPPEKPPSPVPKSDLVVADFKKLLRADLKDHFGQKTYLILRSLKLTNGQIKGLIEELNNKPDKGIGWAINKIKNLDDISVIPDLDQLEAQRQEEAQQEKQKAISQAQQWQQWEKEAASKEEAFEIKLKSRGQWERHLELEAERKAAEKERIERTVSKPFSEIKPLFLEYAGELADRYLKLSDDQLLANREFKNYCRGEFWECSN